MQGCHKFKISSPKSCRLRLVTLWKTYLDIQYLLFCCPFRLIISKDGYSAKLQSNIVQKAVCFTYKVFGFFWIFRNLQGSLPSNPKDPSMYLFLAVNVDNLFLKVATVKRFWFDEKKIVQIVNYILNTENGLPFPEASRNFCLSLDPGLWVIIACTIFTGMAFGHWLTGSLYFVTSAKPTGMTILNWNASVWWNGMLDKGRFTFFLDKQVCSVAIESAAALLAALGYLWRLVVGANEELFLLIMTFTMWVTANEFQARLITTNGNIPNQLKRLRSWPDISREYEAIKTLADMVNNVFGWTMFSAVIQTALFNSVNTDDLFQNDSGFDWTKVCTFSVYSFTISVVFLLSADVCKKVCSKTCLNRKFDLNFF